MFSEIDGWVPQTADRRRFGNSINWEEQQTRKLTMRHENAAFLEYQVGFAPWECFPILSKENKRLARLPVEKR